MDMDGDLDSLERGSSGATFSRRQPFCRKRVKALRHHKVSSCIDVLLERFEYACSVVLREQPPGCDMGSLECRRRKAQEVGPYSFC